MRWLMILAALNAYAGMADTAADKAEQGFVLKVTSEHAASARLDGRTIKLFAQPDGVALGLMPIPTLKTPGNYQLDFLDQHGAVIQTKEVTVEDARYLKQNITIAPAVAALKPSPGEQATVGKFRDAVSDERFWKEPFEAPVPGCLTSPFGVQRYQNGKATGDFHAGVDQRGAAGSPIHPITPGVVKIVKKWNLRGGTVAVDHGQGVETIYLHMSAFQAAEGQHVSTSDVLGYIGSTGRSTGPHLHWTMYVNGVPVNPGQWMKLEDCAPGSKPPASPAPPRKKRKKAAAKTAPPQA